MGKIETLICKYPEERSDETANKIKDLVISEMEKQLLQVAETQQGYNEIQYYNQSIKDIQDMIRNL